jgi:hypothetical protein
MTQFYTDFSNYTTGQQPSDWTERWNATSSDWLVKSVAGTTGGKVLEHTSTTGARRLITWNTVDNSSDVEILVKVRALTISSTVEPMRIYIRASGSQGSENAYFASLYSNQMSFSKYVNNATTSLVVSPIAHTPQANAWYYFRLRATGTSISLKIWLESNIEPTDWIYTVIDSSLNSGWVGVGAFNINIAQFDFIGVGTNGDSAPSQPSVSIPTMFIQSYTKSKISAQSTKDISTVIFQSDQNLLQWEARADGTGQGSGLLVGSGGAVTSNTDISFDIENEELTLGDKTYRINIYGQNESGVWSIYG